MAQATKVLIVDDSKDFQEVLAIKFKAAGFEVATADDGEDGIAKAKEFLPAIIMMDVKMPKLDGVAAMLKLREDASTRNIKIILLTAYGDPQPDVYRNDQRFAQELGAHEYLLKSQDLDEIIQKTKEFLAR